MLYCNMQSTPQTDLGATVCTGESSGWVSACSVSGPGWHTADSSGSVKQSGMVVNGGMGGG